MPAAGMGIGGFAAPQGQPGAAPATAAAPGMPSQPAGAPQTTTAFDPFGAL